MKATSQRVTFAGMRSKAALKNKEAINGDDSKQKDSDYSWVDKLGFWPRKIWYYHILSRVHNSLLWTLGIMHKHLCFIVYLYSGFGLSIVAGLLYSLCFTFMQLMELCSDDEHKSVKGDKPSANWTSLISLFLHTAIDYTFGLFTGILLASSFYFVVYAIYRQNKPVVYPKIILPGLLSGIMWGIATSIVPQK